MRVNSSRGAAREKAGDVTLFRPERRRGRLGSRGAVSHKIFTYLRRRQRAAEEVALHHIAARGTQRVDVLLLLHAFRDEAQPEPARNADHRRYDRGARAAHTEIADERLVDLDAADGQRLEIPEGRVPRAEIVDGDANAKPPQPSCPVCDRVHVLDEHVLGDFQLEGVRRHVVSPEGVDHPVHEVRPIELPCREVHPRPAGAGIPALATSSSPRTPTRGRARPGRRSARFLRRCGRSGRDPAAPGPGGATAPRPPGFRRGGYLYCGLAGNEARCACLDGGAELVLQLALPGQTALMPGAKKLMPSLPFFLT